MKQLLFSLLLLMNYCLTAQQGYWQQQIDYKIQVDFDHNNHQFKGKEFISYANNSPDTLDVLYFHLYYNAFQPNSSMDVRSRNIPDPDKRIGDRISKLNPNEIGYHKIISFLQNDHALNFEISGTILKVKLHEPMLPNSISDFVVSFESQVPVQIRRTGRNNIEGIDYSMSQWYPKLCEYDRRGWHANPYVAREYHGVWGNFEVTITMDSAYTIAATGVLQNPNEIGHGYGEKTSENTARLAWNFKAANVHDFVWAADRDYLHTISTSEDGTQFHFFYQNDTAILKNWSILPEYTMQCFRLMNEMVGPYPYPSYSVIQGGDGGMEYPMATLILGNGKQNGLIGVTVHEAIHSWFQAVIATDEGYFPWMDEGFNTYYDNIVTDSLFNIPNKFPQKHSYNAYIKLLQSENFEPISIHADHYLTNKAYGTASYSMGCVLLSQLSYIIGLENFNRTMKRYYQQWKFKHPEPNDFMRLAEKESGMQLDWFFNYFTQTSRKIDYSIENVLPKKDETTIVLKNVGSFPMPIDLVVELNDGTKRYYSIPLDLMLDGKKSEQNIQFESLLPWPWTHPDYEFKIDVGKKDFVKVTIDPTQRLADVDVINNSFPKNLDK